MFDESWTIIRKNKESFQDNVKDTYGDYIVEEYFAELEKETRHLQETDDEAKRETRSIKDLLRELRAIV